MKRKILGLVVAVAILLPVVSNAAGFSGNSQTVFGKYTLAPAEGYVVQNNVAFKSWALTYNEHQENYTLLCAPSPKGCCEITVKGEGFEIVYSARDGVFGVQLVNKTDRSVKLRDVMKKINKEQLANQKVLTRNPKTQEEYLGLVACYLPLLLS